MGLAEGPPRRVGELGRRHLRVVAQPAGRRHARHAALVVELLELGGRRDQRRRVGLLAHLGQLAAPEGRLLLQLLVSLGHLRLELLNLGVGRV